MPEVRERLEREFYYLLDKEGQLLLYIKRAGRTDPVVEPILKEEGVPQDLRFVPVAESGLLFRSISPAGAVGYWQFMRETAKQYGLQVDSWVDERRDLAMSTKAAVRYLKALHKEFGSWTTALAGYNWGRTKLARAVREQGTKDYYDLYLPEETDRYVFKIIVLKLILEDPAAYSIRIPENGKYLPKTTVSAQISSKLFLPMDILSSCAVTSPRTLRHINPWMIKNTLPPGTYSFQVPKGQKREFKRCLKKELSTIKLTVHVVSSGEFLEGIAEEYGVTVHDIEQWNNISRWRPIYPGQRLVILFGAGR